MSQSPFLFQAVGKAHEGAHAGQQEAVGGDSATNPVHAPAQLPNTPLQEQRRAQERSPDNKPENAEGPFRALVPAVCFDEVGSPLTTLSTIIGRPAMRVSAAECHESVNRYRSGAFHRLVPAAKPSKGPAQNSKTRRMVFVFRQEKEQEKETP